MRGSVEEVEENAKKNTIPVGETRTLCALGR